MVLLNCFTNNTPTIAGNICPIHKLKASTVYGTCIRYDSQIGTKSPGTNIMGITMNQSLHFNLFIKYTIAEAIIPTNVPPIMSNGPRPPIMVLLSRLLIPIGIIKNGNIAGNAYNAVAILI